jgi:hypothetical protein
MDNFFQGVTLVLEPDVLIVIFLASLYGLAIGALPGLTATMAIGMSTSTILAPVATHSHLTDWPPARVEGIFGWMMLYLSILTISLVWHGLVTVRNKKQHLENRRWPNVGLNLLVIGAALLCAYRGWLIDEVLMMGIAVVGVAYKDEPEATQAFLDELGDPFTMVLVDREGRAGLDLGVSGVPESFAVDAMGRIVAKSSGPLLTDADLERLTSALVAPARPLPTARTLQALEAQRAR